MAGAQFPENTRLVDSDSFTNWLVAEGWLDSASASRAEQLAERSGKRLVPMLSQLGLIDDADLAKALSEFCAVPLLSPAELPDNLPTEPTFNAAWLKRNNVLPLDHNGDTLHVAMGDPLDEDAISALAFVAGCKPVAVSVAALSDISDRLQVFESQGSSAELQPAAFRADELERIVDLGSEAPVIRLADRLLAAAARRGASDIHIEPMGTGITVRFRIDGTLREIERLSSELAEPLASRIKVMAGLDISESRLPQDGRLKFTAAGRDIDVRVATSPTVHGEMVVLRLLGRQNVSLELASLGLPPAALDELLQALAKPNGIILLTGPTGSGKTTTLYAALSKLRRPDVKILTVEDPVEIMLDGVNQVQIRPEIGLDYARTLRAFLRQDPDILMIGEIRDRDTADIALRAALTGHLVLSTLHTNSALGAFTRLTDIGIEPYLAASTIHAVIAQRLVRKLCSECAVEAPLPDTHVRLFQRHDVAPPRVVFEASAAGCSQCNGTGFKGRAPLIEIVSVGAKLQQLVRDGKAEEYAVPAIATLGGHGLSLVADGVTSLGEVARVTGLS